MGITDVRNSPSLELAMAKLGNNRPLSEFLESAPTLTHAEKFTIVRQAKLLLGGIYAHLPLKRAGHAVDPVQQLELLEHRLVSASGQGEPSLLSDWAFHAEMLQIFKGLRDVHTKYRLPDPFRTCTAILPFMMEDYFEAGRRRFLVTHVQEDFHHETFRPGVVVTHWNGTPIERAVQLHADREDGSNSAARFAVGLATMTARPLATQMPPDEEWVMVRYDTKETAANDILFPWRVWNRKVDKSRRKFRSVEDENSEMEALSSMNDRINEIHDSRKHLFAPQAVAAEQRIAAATKANVRSTQPTPSESLALAFGSGALKEAAQKIHWRADAFDRAAESRFPGAVQFATYTYERRDFGYLRIRNFRPSEVSEFVMEVMRIVRRMPPNGLVIDVRGNGGGVILNGEMLLQLFTPKRIEPAQFQFINTALTAQLCTEPPARALTRNKGESTKDFAARRRRAKSIRQARKELAKNWGQSIRQSNLTGAAFSTGKPLTDPKFANHLGQHYFGPVILITDAQCYSTTDIFAAGFQDHEIGPIMGVDNNTGAGGANVWTHHRQLVPYLENDDVGIESLPRGVSMSVSIRRSLRVGPRFGQPLEDLGVAPDIRCQITKEDLLNSNIDMITAAIEVLHKLPTRHLRAFFMPMPGETNARLVTRNIARVDVYFDERPVHTQNIKNGVTEFTIPFATHNIKRIEVHGYQWLTDPQTKCRDLHLVARVVKHVPGRASKSSRKKSKRK